MSDRSVCRATEITTGRECGNPLPCNWHRMLDKVNVPPAVRKAVKDASQGPGLGVNKVDIRDLPRLEERILNPDNPRHQIVEHSPMEVRSVSSSGGEKGVKPERYSLIPKAPLDLLARVYGFGSKKYAPHNYRKGYEWSKSYDALQRHLAAWWEREENDPESGLSHLGHAAFHIFALICFSSDSRYAEYDDRYTP